MTENIKAPARPKTVWTRVNSRIERDRRAGRQKAAGGPPGTHSEEEKGSGGVRDLP